MSILRFSDGVEVDTSGPIRKLSLSDGLYVVGKGMCVPVRDDKEADEIISECGVQC